MFYRTFFAALASALLVWFSMGCSLLDPPSGFAREPTPTDRGNGTALPIEPDGLPAREEVAALSPFHLQIPPVESDPADARPPGREVGIASWYRDWRTASGEPYNRHAFTAAHPTLPFGAVVKVRNLDNEKEAVVRITDRGPFVNGRIIDLSEAAARQIDILHAGLAPVELLVLTLP